MQKSSIAYGVTLVAVALLAVASIFLVPNSKQLLDSEHYSIGLNPTNEYLEKAWSQAAQSPQPGITSASSLGAGSTSEPKSVPQEPTLSFAEAIQTLPNYGVGIYFDPDPDGSLADDGYPLPKSNIDGYPIIAGVTTNGAADNAGLTKGTVITSFDGESSQGLSIFQLAQKIRATNASSLAIGVLGDEDPIDVTRRLLIGE